MPRLQKSQETTSGLLLKTLILLSCCWHLASCGDLFEPPEFFKAIREGMTEAEVKELIAAHKKPGWGPTLVAEHTADTAPEDYYVGGYAHPDRAISRKVLIWIHGEHICYVYISKKELVEYVFIGGS